MHIKDNVSFNRRKIFHTSIWHFDTRKILDGLMAIKQRVRLGYICMRLQLLQKLITLLALLFTPEPRDLDVYSVGVHYTTFRERLMLMDRTNTATTVNTNT